MFNKIIRNPAMINQLRRTWGLMVFSLVFGSCGPVLYSNVGQNVPMFLEKGEFSGSINYASSYGQDVTDADGLGLQAAYAFSDKWAGILSYYSMKNASVTEDEDWQAKGSYFEIGGGRYGSFGSKYFAYEVLGGIGFGGIKNNSNLNNIDANIFKPFLQPSFGVISKYADFIITSRFGYVSYTSNSYRLEDDNMRMQADKFFEEQKSSFVFEPGFTIRGGYKNIKIQIQYNFSSFKNEYDGFYPVNDNYGGIGLYFLISNRYKAKLTK